MNRSLITLCTLSVLSLPARARAQAEDDTSFDPAPANHQLVVPMTTARSALPRTDLQLSYDWLSKSSTVSGTSLSSTGQTATVAAHGALGRFEVGGSFMALDRIGTSIDGRLGSASDASSAIGVVTLDAMANVVDTDVDGTRLLVSPAFAVTLPTAGDHHLKLSIMGRTADTTMRAPTIYGFHPGIRVAAQTGRVVLQTEQQVVVLHNSDVSSHDTMSFWSSRYSVGVNVLRPVQLLAQIDAMMQLNDRGTANADLAAATLGAAFLPGRWRFDAAVQLPFAGQMQDAYDVTVLARAGYAF